MDHDPDYDTNPDEAGRGGRIAPPHRDRRSVSREEEVSSPTSRLPHRPSRGIRVSRFPAFAVLCVALVVIAGVGLALGHPRQEQTSPVVAVGYAAGIGMGGAAGSEYSEVEQAALSAPLPEDAVSVHVPILMYHYVDETPPPAGPYADGLTVRTGDFVDEMEYLVRFGYQTVSLADVYLAMAGLRELPDKPVVLTFDDGGLDNYTVAFPILKSYGLTGTFFVITRSVGAEGQMSWEQLREMATEGMSIQSHSFSHPDLRGVSDSRLRSELVGSRDSIAAEVGEPQYVLCYPAGAYDERVIEGAKAAGYVMAVATDKGVPLDPGAVFEIRRSRVQPFLPLGTFAKLVD